MRLRRVEAARHVSLSETNAPAETGACVRSRIWLRLHWTQAPACGRSHILPPQQLFPFSLDIMGHLPPAQQVILPF